MSKICKTLLLFFVLLFCEVFSVFALDESKNTSIQKMVDDNTWAFCVYMVDTDRTVNYNSIVLNEMESLIRPLNVKLYSETSLNKSFDAFLKKCKEEVVADYKVLILIGEGEGVYGIRKSELSYLTLGDIKNALSLNYETNNKSPEFDLTFMDCSLMACAEAGLALKGYSKYLVAMESLAYECKGFYTNWFGEFLRNTNISSSDLGKLIIDKYKSIVDEKCLKHNLMISTTASLIDIDLLYDSYNLYFNLVKEIIKRTTKDNFMLTTISRVAGDTVSAGDTIDKTFAFNMIDYMDFMNNIKRYFPISCRRIIEKLQKCLISKVDVGFVTNTCGISMFFPTQTFKGFDNLINEIFSNLIENDYIRLLYNYKLTGKVSPEFNNLMRNLGIKKLAEFNFDLCDDFVNVNPVINNSFNFTYKLPRQYKNAIQYAYIDVHKRENDKLVCYNEDSYFRFDDNNDISFMFEGKWDSINDIPLFFNLLSKTKDYKKFYVKILYNGEIKLLYNIFQEDLNASKIVGIIEDAQNTRLVGNVLKPLKNGDEISLYKYEIDSLTNIINEKVASSFIYNENYRIENIILGDGEYTCKLIIEDLAGNMHKGQDIFFNIDGGNVKDINTAIDLQSKFK